CPWDAPERVLTTTSAERSMTPLRITWRLKTPIVVRERPYHLDDLLNRQVGSFDAMRVERAGDGDRWVWKASHLLITPVSGPLLSSPYRPFLAAVWAASPDDAAGELRA